MALLANLPITGPPAYVLRTTIPVGRLRVRVDMSLTKCNLSVAHPEAEMGGRRGSVIQCMLSPERLCRMVAGCTDKKGLLKELGLSSGTIAADYIWCLNMAGAFRMALGGMIAAASRVAPAAALLLLVPAMPCQSADDVVTPSGIRIKVEHVPNANTVHVGLFWGWDPAKSPDALTVLIASHIWLGRNAEYGYAMLDLNTVGGSIHPRWQTMFGFGGTVRVPIDRMQAAAALIRAALELVLREGTRAYELGHILELPRRATAPERAAKASCLGFLFPFQPVSHLTHAYELSSTSPAIRVALADALSLLKRGNLFLAIAGGATRDQMIAFAEEAFGGLPSGPGFPSIPELIGSTAEGIGQEGDAEEHRSATIFIAVKESVTRPEHLHLLRLRRLSLTELARADLGGNWISMSSEMLAPNLTLIEMRLSSPRALPIMGWLKFADNIKQAFVNTIGTQDDRKASAIHGDDKGASMRPRILSKRAHLLPDGARLAEPPNLANSPELFERAALDWRVARLVEEDTTTLKVSSELDSSLLVRDCTILGRPRKLVPVRPLRKLDEAPL